MPDAPQIHSHLENVILDTEKAATYLNIALYIQWAGVASAMEPNSPSISLHSIIYITVHPQICMAIMFETQRLRLWCHKLPGFC